MRGIVDQLVETRKRRGLLQGKVAALMDTDGPHLSHLERGRKKPSLETVEAWADALGFRLALVEKNPATGRRLPEPQRSERKRAIIAAYNRGDKISVIMADHKCSQSYPATLAARAGLSRRPSWYGER